MAWYDDLLEWAGSDTGSKILDTGLKVGGTLYSANQASGAQQAVSNQQMQQAQQAAESAMFRPVGITSRFGASGFKYDPQGRLIGAGYQAAPDIAAQREALLKMGTGALTAAGEYPASLVAPRRAAEGLFGLANQFLPTSTATSASPEAMSYVDQLRRLGGAVTPTSYDTSAAAQDYMQRQQGLLAPQREQQLAELRNRLQQTGRAGLATGSTMAGNLQATNPEMAAYFNAIAQQDAQLAANAEQLARQNLQQDITFGTGLTGRALQTQEGADELARQRMLQNLQVGTGLFGTGLGLFDRSFGSQRAALTPFSDYLAAAQTLEGLSQNPLELSRTFGSSAAASGAQAGSLLSNAARAAAALNSQAAADRSGAIQGAIAGATDPISQLIRGLVTPTTDEQRRVQTAYGSVPSDVQFYGA
jgi:hypothetical protein